MPKMQVQSLNVEHPLEVELAAHSHILAWEIPETEEHGRPQSMEWQRVGHNLGTQQQQECNGCLPNMVLLGEGDGYCFATSFT